MERQGLHASSLSQILILVEPVPMIIDGLQLAFKVTGYQRLTYLSMYRAHTFPVPHGVRLR